MRGSLRRQSGIDNTDRPLFWDRNNTALLRISQVDLMNDMAALHTLQ